MTPDAEARALWERASTIARGALSESSYKMWFAEVQPDRLDEGTLQLTAPSAYVRNWIASRYMELLTKAVADAAGDAVRVEIRAAEARSDAEPPPSEPGPDPSPPAEEVPGGPFTDRYTFDTFVPGPSNKFAHAAAMAVAEAPPSSAYNPLFIYGGVGLGKTHLLLAIGHHMMRLHPGIQAKYVTSEQFVTEFIRAVRERQGYQFQRKHRDVHVLLVDDIQFLARAEETQTEFFHTFNALHGAQRQIVIASDRSPQELTALEERLRSRFRWGLCVDVQPPDLETRIAILQMKALRDGIHVPDSVTRFIAEKIEHNIRELEGALLRVAAFASLSREPIELTLAERALEDLLPDGGQEISAELIMDETAAYFALEREDLISKNRSRPLTTARHMAMYLQREFTGLSLIKIAECFDRDHTTALHGIKKIEKLMSERGSVYRQVQELTRRIKTKARGA